jgi:hypothetical protein
MFIFNEVIKLKGRSFIVIAVEIIMILVLSAYSNSTVKSNISVKPSQSSGQIYLYGEAHGVDKILDKEFELWYEYYHKQNMRHLFVELSYYSAEFLNICMRSDSNDILDKLYSDWAGTACYKPKVKEFYEKIKSKCPETIFHGTDIGHQYDTTGERFLKYLQSNNLEDSEQHLLTKKAIEQGRYFYGHHDDVYRENKMVENFKREFDKLSGESIMGIYGAAHTGLEAMDYSNSVPCMANQLKKLYCDSIHSEDLLIWSKYIEPYRVDTIRVGGKDYKASYFGKQDLKGFKDYAFREYWRLENSYKDFKDRPKTQDLLPYDQYPMLIEIGQVFVIDYTKTDGSVIRSYYRSDGDVWNNIPETEEFTVK